MRFLGLSFGLVVALLISSNSYAATCSVKLEGDGSFRLYFNDRATNQVFSGGADAERVLYAHATTGRCIVLSVRDLPVCEVRKVDSDLFQATYDGLPFGDPYDNEAAALSAVREAASGRACRVARQR